jgi:FixJ family two-component response regulator
MLQAKSKIVVVEDDAEMRQAVERLLNAAGFQTQAFPSAEAMLERNSFADAACLVLDIHLPGVSGFELYQLVAVRRDALPVIFITADDEPDSRSRAQEAGAVGYFTKPFGGETLLNALFHATSSGSARVCRFDLRATN